MNKFSNEYLRRRYQKTVIVQGRVGDRFAAYAEEIADELLRRYRAAIYKVACRVLRNNCNYRRNQFSIAAQFSDAVIDGLEVLPESEYYEIGGYYTKNRCPVVVEF